MSSLFNKNTTALDVVRCIDLSGKNVVITGGASGLGIETSRAMAQAGAHVTLAVRNVQQGFSAAEKIGGNVSVAHVDLAQPTTVKQFVADWGTTPLHVLINNAGVMAQPLERTSQGWESQFATNHLAHFALTTGLTDALLAANGSRVVVLSSAGHKISSVDFADTHFESRAYDKWIAYGQAKSANALMAFGFNQRFALRGITANSLHPGAIMTGLQKFLPEEEMRAMGWLTPDGNPISLFKSPEQGAATSVWAATSPELEGRGGLYLEDCGIGIEAEPTNRISGFAPHIMDVESADRLWELSIAALSRL